MHNIIRFSALVCAAVLTFCASHRALAAGTSGPLDLAQVLSRLTDSPEVTALDASIAAIRARRPAVLKYPEPTVSLAVQPLPVQTRVGPQRLKLGVMQGVPWLAKLDRKAELIDAQVLAQKARKDAVLARLQRDVRVPWAQLAQLEATAAIVQQQHDLLAGLEPSVLARLRIGKASYEDAQRLRLVIGELAERRESLLDRRAPLIDKIVAVAGLARTATFQKPRFFGPKASWHQQPKMAELRACVADNPQLAAAEAMVSAAQAKVAAIDVQRMPDFAVGIDWIMVGEAVMPNVADSGSDALMLMAAVKLPVWRRAYDAQTSSARSEVTLARARKEVLLRKAEARLSQLLFTIRDARRKHDLYSKDLVPRAQSALTTALTSYANGKARFNDLIELQRKLLTFSIRLVMADAQQDIALAELDLLIARPIAAARIAALHPAFPEARK